MYIIKVQRRKKLTKESNDKIQREEQRKAKGLYGE